MSSRTANIIIAITCCFFLGLYLLAGRDLYRIVSSINEREEEMQQCFLDGYEITVEDEVKKALPEDWRSWYYTIDHNAKTVDFYEKKPERNYRSFQVQAPLLAASLLCYIGFIASRPKRWD